jgi:transketolase
MRAPSPVLYPEGFRFEFGKATILREDPDERVVIVTSGRAVHEALAAAGLLAAKGIAAGVIDMSTVDEAKLLELTESGKLVVFAEQNNGYLWQNFARLTTRNGKAPGTVLAINTLTAEGRPQFIHSGLYEELLEAFHLTPAHIANAVTKGLTE